MTENGQKGAPLVSVIIPSYQRAGLIADALDSVACQTWHPLEIVIIDDGSSDATEAVVTAWASQHPEIPLRYRWQENAGGNVARNHGIREAQGTYIAFLDSDDVWHPDKTARQLALLQGDDGIGAVYCGLREVQAETGEVLREPGLALPSGDVLSRLLVRDETGPTSAWIIRKAHLDQVGGFDPDLAARQDWDLWIRLAAVTRISAVDAPLLDLRHHGGPRTASDPTRELRAYRAIRRKNAALLAAQPLRIRLAARSAFHRRSGRVQLRYMGRRLPSLGQYLVATALWPVEPDNWFALLGWILPDRLRSGLRQRWNKLLGKTNFAIRSH